MTGGTTPNVTERKGYRSKPLVLANTGEHSPPARIDWRRETRALHLIQISFFFKRLHCHAFGFLKSLGLVDDARTNAKAFARLQNKLFRLSWVEGVAVHGLAESPFRPTSRSGADVFVITSQSSSGLFEQDVKRIVSETNDRYGTGMKASIVSWRSFDSSLRSHPTY
jgi:hypothetical protein